MKILREKYLKKYAKQLIFKSKKIFFGIEGQKFKRQRTKIKRERDDMDKFEEQQMKKVKPIIRNRFDKLI